MLIVLAHLLVFDRLSLPDPRFFVSYRAEIKSGRQLEDKPASKARWGELRPVVDVSEHLLVLFFAYLFRQTLNSKAGS